MTRSLSFVAGLAAGVAIGLLIAPRRGHEARELLSGKVTALFEPGQPLEAAAGWAISAELDLEAGRLGGDETTPD